MMRRPLALGLDGRVGPAWPCAGPDCLRRLRWSPRRLRTPPKQLLLPFGPEREMEAAVGEAALAAGGSSTAVANQTVVNRPTDTALWRFKVARRVPVVPHGRPAVRFRRGDPAFGDGSVERRLHHISATVDAAPALISVRGPRVLRAPGARLGSVFGLRPVDDEDAASTERHANGRADSNGLLAQRSRRRQCAHGQ